MKYSKFKGTIYIPKGDSDGDTGYITITTDGKTIYTSPEMTKSSAPVHFDVSVKGCNNLKIGWVEGTKDRYIGDRYICIGDTGFYQ